MKQKKQIFNNRILKAVVLICFLVVAGISVFAGRYLYLSDKEADKQTGEAIAAKDEVITKEAGAVMAQKKFFGQSFSDESDGKKAIRVVEVIPHEICSVFPYMVDWKDVKSYDEKTFLGYDGLRYLTVKATGASKNRHQFSLTKDGITRDYLDNYNVNFIPEGNWSVDIGIWRQTKMDSDILGANGYFEYVGDKGNAKGLYNINLGKIVKNSDKTAYGIRYDIMAMKRQGSQPKQGEWEVKNPRYYWAKDYAQTAYPTSEVHQHTGFNYDLKFKPDASGNYRVKEVKLPDSKPIHAGYEYVAELAADVVWNGGYIYSKNGNYKVSSKTSIVVNDAADWIGNYIRISNDNINDGSGLQGGYFRLCTSEDNIQVGDTVYSVTFSAVAGGGQGSYILNPAAVQSAIVSDRSQALKDILFQYAGENKGNYDVVFTYSENGSGGGAPYSCELVQVSNGDGRYALTSTEESADDLYEKVGSGNGDYSKVVTSIDCAGIDYKECTFKVNDYYSYTIETMGYYNQELPGLTTGCNENGGEYGNWVFHPIDSDERNGITKIEEFENGQIPKRIYVYDQNRKNRFYAQNGFENNEWFKLLLYLSTEDESKPLAYDDYANGALTPLEIKAKYKKDIEAFDRAYRIEIIQRTPEELKKSDVEKADLIYFGNSIGLPGLNEGIWNDLIRTYGINLPSYTADSLKYTSDLSTEALMAIYHNCLYERTTALLFSAECIDEYSGDGSNINTNLGKLGFLTNFFKDPSDFSYFIEGYSEKNEDYSTIHKDNADVTAYKQIISGIGTLYNFGSSVIDGDGTTTHTGDAIPPYRSNVWKKEYFRVVEITEVENGDFKLNSEYVNGDGKYGDNWGSHSWWNFTGKDVLANDITWYIPQLTSNIFDGFLNTRNVWKILKNKKSKEVSEPVIVVTNADGSNISEIESVTPVYYYYVDAFAYGGGSSDFDIDFRVNWRPEEITQPTALKRVTVTRENGSAVFSQENPNYKTDYTCNVAGDFIKDGVFDSDITSKDYTITAVDAADKTDKVIVRFIVREAFMLN